MLRFNGIEQCPALLIVRCRAYVKLFILFRNHFTESKQSVLSYHGHRNCILEYPICLDLSGALSAGGTIPVLKWKEIGFDINHGPNILELRRARRAIRGEPGHHVMIPANLYTDSLSNPQKHRASPGYRHQLQRASPISVSYC